MPKATKRRVTLTDFAYGGTVLPAGPGGQLVLGDDPEDCVEIQAQLWFELLHEDEEGDVLESVLQIADEDGAVWEARSVWRPEDLVLQVGALTQIRRPAFFSETMEDASAFGGGLLIEGCRVTLDDRFYRQLTLGTRIYEIQMKYQGVLLDLAVVENQEMDLVNVLARVSGLHTESASASGSLEMGEVPPFVFEVEFREGLFIQRYDREDDSWDRTAFPRAVVFQKTRVKAEPQDGVRYDGPKAEA